MLFPVICLWLVAGSKAKQTTICRTYDDLIKPERNTPQCIRETKFLPGPLGTVDRGTLEKVVKDEVQMYCVDGVVYGGQKIYVPYKSRREDVQFKQASEICESRNCQLAELSSDEMYRVVEKYVRSTWNFASTGGISVGLWIGGRFEQHSNPQHLITLSDGRRVTLTNWNAGKPSTGSGHKTWVHMAIHLSKDPYSVSNGHHTWPATKTRHVPVCACNM